MGASSSSSLYSSPSPSSSWSPSSYKWWSWWQWSCVYCILCILYLMVVKVLTGISLWWHHRHIIIMIIIKVVLVGLNLWKIEKPRWRAYQLLLEFHWTWEIMMATIRLSSDRELISSSAAAILWSCQEQPEWRRVRGWSQGWLHIGLDTSMLRWWDSL